MEFEIPRSHPRYHSLVLRERLVEAFKNGIVVSQGLIAHGRGECFDYLLGEKSHEFAVEAARVTAAWFLTARHPIISVNGNYAALAAEEIRKLQEVTGAPVEVNIFYRTEERVRLIEEHLRSHGVKHVLGSSCEKTRVPGLESPRGIVCRDGIASADFVLLAIEDGDRTEALVAWGKTVAAIDLNPFSRTAQKASITIVDEAVRATRLIVREVEKLKDVEKSELKAIIETYDNRKVLAKAFKAIMEKLGEAASKGVLL
ncbi:MAG: phosphopantothenate/pantothenate synthetase [Desulfurococcales archaeon]|nr:phosphopantothenate/pantothenate synthetase [Desulfurococcales archaeon]